MTNLLKWALSNKTASIAIVALIIFGVVLGFEVFSLRPETAAALAELKASKAHAVLIDKKAAADRVVANADIAALTSANNALRSGLTAKDGQITSLTGHQHGLEAALALAKTDSERVPLLTYLVEDWTAKFTLADSKCVSYEGIIFNLNAALADKDIVIASWHSQYDAQVAVVAAGDRAVSDLRADLRRAKFWSTVKSGVIVGSASYVAYKYIWPIVRDVIARLFGKK